MMLSVAVVLKSNTSMIKKKEKETFPASKSLCFIISMSAYQLEDRLNFLSLKQYLLEFQTTFMQ